MAESALTRKTDASDTFIKVRQSVPLKSRLNDPLLPHSDHEKLKPL